MEERECFVPDCSDKSKTLYSAPVDTERLTLWKKQVGGAYQPQTKIFVCEKHFEKRFLTVNKFGATILADYAVPTLCLPTNEDQTEILEKIEILQEKIKCNRLIHGATYSTVLFNHCQKQVIKASEQRDFYEGLSFRIYINNPEAYKRFCSVLHLMSFEEVKKTLFATVNSCDKDILLQRLLAMKVKTMIENKKECYVSVEEINLTPKYYYHIKRDLILGINNIGKTPKPRLATMAIVLTLHGIIEKWKQCICIAYTDDSTDYCEVWQWIRRCIEKIALGTGFRVRAVVYNGDSKYLNRDIQAEKPYMLNIAEGKVYYICEASSLLKLFFYNMMTYGYFDAHNKLASKQDFIDFIQLSELDEQKYRSSNIREQHLQPYNDIKQIKEVFSYDVAARMLLYSDYGRLDIRTAEASAKLVLSILKLINVLNPKVIESNNKMEQKVTVTISYLHIALQMCSSLNLKCNGKVKPRDEFVENVKITINSILAMHEESKSKKITRYSPFCQLPYSFDYFHTMVDKVVSKQKHMVPSAKTVDLIFRQVRAQNFLQPINKNTKTDLEEMLNHIHNLFNCVDRKSVFLSFETPITQHKIVRADYKKLNLSNNPLKELTHFLLEKTKAAPQHNNCETCKINHKDDDNSENCMVIFVKKMEDTFKSFMSLDTLDLQDEKILSSLLNAFESNEKIHKPCECFPDLFIKTLYLRFRIYHTLRKNNRLLKTTFDSKQPLFLDL